MNKMEWKAEKQQLAEKYKIHLLRSTYQHFGLLAILTNLFVLLRLYGLIWQKNIKTIHAWCTPAGAFAYILARFSGKRLIIDSFEPHAEAMLENGSWTKKSLAYKSLIYFEKRMAKRAVAIIGTTAAMQEYAAKTYNTKLKQFFVKPSGVNTTLFSPNKDSREKNRKELALNENAVVGVYIGKFGGIYLYDEIILLIKAAQEQWGKDFYLFIYTSSDTKEIEKKLQKQHIDLRQICLSSYMPHQQVPQYLNIADFAINPVKPVPTKRYCTSIKDGEYWAMGLPIIIPPDISDDSDLIAKENIGVIWEDFSLQGCKTAIENMHELLNSRDIAVIKKKIRNIAIEKRSFNNAKEIYNSLYR
jgi:glycosyltransferase involved in cell wall biosynthesis